MRKYYPLIAVFFSVLAIRLLWFDVFFIPSASMETTIVPGDFVLVNKSTYAIRLPSWSWSVGLNINRVLPARCQRGDIIVFEHTVLNSKAMIPSTTTMVKRCIGLPGDTLKNRNYRFCYEHIEYDVETIKSKYTARITTNRCYSQILPLFKDGMAQVANGNLILAVSKKQLDSLRMFCRSTFEEIISRDAMNSFGDVDFVIPARGMKLFIDHSNFDFYAPIISKNEKKEVLLANDCVFIDGKMVESYTFQNDYYFVLGDNRANSIDSRSFGLVSHDDIVGKVVCVLWSQDSARSIFSFRTDRFFKSLQ
jgi:signal peptidase I